MDKEEWYRNIIVYHNENTKNISFEAQKGVGIEDAVTDSILYMCYRTSQKYAVLTFNDVELKINRNDYWKDKVEEYWHCLEIESKREL